MSIRGNYALPKFKGHGDAPPKVLIVVEASGGGSGRHVIELVDGLAAIGCDVHLLYSELRIDATFRAALGTMQGVHLKSVPMRREPHWSDIGCALEIRRYMNEHGKFDVVHAHSSKAGVLARIAAVGTGAARIYTPHAMRTMDPTLHPALHEFYRVIEVALARMVSEGIIAVSEHEREHVIAQGVPSAITCTVVNGIPVVAPFDRAAIRAGLGIAPDEICLGFIGRMVPQKAPERFVTALAAVAGRFPSVRGVMLGTGPLEAAVHQVAREAGVEERIVWVTDQPGPAVLPAYDMLVMPSLYEGMPYVLLEALAVGVPIVATDIGGAIEAIDDGVTGFIVPQNDGDALIARIAALIGDEALRQSMSAASLRKSADMSIARMVEQTLQVYQAGVRARQQHDHRLPVGLDPKRAG